ncbi:MAG: hypothetical protein Q7T97_10140 [Burkholderiaceae bacterium]|nr:hypothetical protein [Burkholderiaceae bacterium]
MRTFVLILLWLGVGGFGLMTLCSGIFSTSVPQIALPFGLIAGGLTWACWRGVQRRQKPPPAKDGSPPP